MPPGIHSCHELVLRKSKCHLTYGPRFGKIKIVDHTLVKPTCWPHFGQIKKEDNWVSQKNLSSSNVRWSVLINQGRSTPVLYTFQSVLAIWTRKCKCQNIGQKSFSSLFWDLKKKLLFGTQQIDRGCDISIWQIFEQTVCLSNLQIIKIHKNYLYTLNIFCHWS